MNAFDNISACALVSHPLSPVESALANIEREQGGTVELVSQLHQRLSSALRPTLPVSGSTDKQLEPAPDSELVGALDSRAKAARHVNNELASLLDRLTL